MWSILFPFPGVSITIFPFLKLESMLYFQMDLGQCFEYHDNDDKGNNGSDVYDEYSDNVKPGGSS